MRFAMQRLAIALAVAAIATVDVAGQGAAPKPGPEHGNLARFVGTWKMEGKMNPGPMGPGGAFTGTETCRAFEGFHIVCDSEGSGTMGPMKAHMIMTWDGTAKKYRYFAVNNTPVAEMAEGTLKGTTWEFRSQSSEGGKKLWSIFSITETSPTLHNFSWKISEDGQKWTTVMEGQSVKQ
jgi:uncharacterized protein DUF1579